MKKLFPYILIVLIVVQLLAPFTVGVGVKNNPIVRVNKAEATFANKISLKETPSKTDKTITINFSVAYSQIPAPLTKEGVRITKTDPVSGATELRIVPDSDFTAGGQDTDGFYIYTGSVLFDNLTPNTPYLITAEARQINTLVPTWAIIKMKYNFSALWDPKNDTPVDDVVFIIKIDDTVTTNPTGITTPQTQATKTAQNNNAEALPVCSIIPPKVGGCFAQLLYYALFVPTSYVFALAGTFFDFTFHYSIQDGSYRTPFVVEGWGIVRDFCNMFFIFILLYIAFGTILNLHSAKTKEMIINVVIIGLLINFSLFAAQIMIDTSNILARVFYNSDTIKITQGTNAANGVANATPTLKIGPNGEIPLSAAIVNKVNPQNLIINGRKAVVIQDKVTGETGDATQTEGNLGTGAFILITLLATAVNIVGIITFLSIGLIFVTRVIGLWFAMILAPFAFFSYTVPAMQEWDMVGWKKWWPETLKLAFLAPIFIFFMYLIIAFLEKGLSLVKSNDTSTMDGMTFVISIIVPFIFIMVLLMKAKDIAKKMSGTMGQSITNGIAAVGGVALGGAALGTAFLGRKMIGAGVATASRSESAMHLASQRFEHNKKLEEWEKNNKNGVAQGPKPIFIAPKHGDEIKDATGRVKLDEKGNALKYKDNAFTRLGASLNEKQMKIGGVDFARSQMDETKKAAGLVDASGNLVDDSNLSGTNEKKMKDTFARTKRAETETQVRKGVNAKGEDILIEGYKGEDAYKSANRKEIADRVRNESVDNVDGDGKLTPEALRKVENELNVKLNATVKIETDKQLASNFDKLRTESKQKVGGVERAFSRTNTGSWDIRNLSNIKTDQREGMFTKIPVAMIAAVAMGVRGGLKSSGLSGGGIKVEGNFMKDLGNTISDSLKGMKVNINLEHVGETKSSADTHGGSVAHH